MNTLHAENKKYLKLAIQTTLFQNREHFLNDVVNNESLIEHMSEEICLRAQKFQEIADSTIYEWDQSDII